MFRVNISYDLRKDGKTVKSVKVADPDGVQGLGIPFRKFYIFKCKIKIKVNDAIAPPFTE